MTMKTMPTRMPTAVVAQAMLDLLRSKVDKNGKLVTISMNTIATELGLDFPRILRAKNVLVEAGIIQEIKDGKTSSYKVLSTNVPSELVFKHKVASEAHERTSTRRAVVAHEPNVAAGLNKSEQRQLAAAVRRFQEASTTLNSKLTQFGLIPELATA